MPFESGPDILSRITALERRLSFLEAQGTPVVPPDAFDALLGHRHRGLTDDAPTLTGPAVEQSVRFPAYTPATLAGDANDWDVGNHTYVRASGGAGDRIVTGIVAQLDGHLLIIKNAGTTNKITFANESASSAAQNRLHNASAVSVEITPHHSVLYLYDATTARWVEISHLV
jgi:hypothetical protein